MDPPALWQSLGSDGLFERRQLLVPGPKRPRAHGPLGGVERPRRSGALRAIDPSARPRSWRTFGPRRLWRHPSLPWLPRRVVRRPTVSRGLLSCHGDTAGTADLPSLPNLRDHDGPGRIPGGTAIGTGACVGVTKATATDRTPGPARAMLVTGFPSGWVRPSPADRRCAVIISVNE